MGVLIYWESVGISEGISVGIISQESYPVCAVGECDRVSMN